VRLRKNTLGVYRLDHDAGLHDDQAIALALGAHHLLDAEAGAERWIRWARAKAEAAVADREVRELEERAAAAARRQAAAVAAGGQPGAPLEGLVLDPVGARKLARDEAHRARWPQYARFAK
jgi:hypothetical protein